MAFDFNDYDDDYVAVEIYNIENEDLRYNAIQSAIDSLEKVDLFWTSKEDKEKAVNAIVNATAKAAFHKCKGHLSSNENSIVHEKEIAELFNIEPQVWQQFFEKGVDRFKGVLIELPDKYLYLSDYSGKPDLPIATADKILINSLPLNNGKSVYAFHSIPKFQRGDFPINANQLPNFSGALYAFRGIYNIDGKRIGDKATI